MSGTLQGSGNAKRGRKYSLSGSCSQTNGEGRQFHQCYSLACRPNCTKPHTLGHQRLSEYIPLAVRLGAFLPSFDLGINLATAWWRRLLANSVSAGLHLPSLPDVLEQLEYLVAVPGFKR